MTKFFAIVSPVLLGILLTGWANASEESTTGGSIPRRCDIYETDGKQIIVCSHRTQKQAEQCKVVRINGKYEAVCAK